MDHEQKMCDESSFTVYTTKGAQPNRVGHASCDLLTRRKAIKNKLARRKKMIFRGSLIFIFEGIEEA
jgi:hypothetical protein